MVVVVVVVGHDNMNNSQTHNKKHAIPNFTNLNANLSVNFTARREAFPASPGPLLGGGREVGHHEEQPERGGVVVHVEEGGARQPIVWGGQNQQFCEEMGMKVCPITTERKA